MRIAFSLLVALPLIAALWCSPIPCTVLQGEMAPPMVGETQAADGLLVAELPPLVKMQSNG